MINLNQMNRRVLKKLSRQELLDVLKAIKHIVSARITHLNATENDKVQLILLSAAIKKDWESAYGEMANKYLIDYIIVSKEDI